MTQDKRWLAPCFLDVEGANSIGNLALPSPPELEWSPTSAASSSHLSTPKSPVKRDKNDAHGLFVHEKPSIWQRDPTPSEAIWGSSFTQHAVPYANPSSPSASCEASYAHNSAPARLERRFPFPVRANPACMVNYARASRYFIIKSYTEDDIYKSIKYGIWTSTEMGNRRLDRAFREATRNGGVVLLFFSVNTSGHFCGVAQMGSPVDHADMTKIWSEDKWKGEFHLLWLSVKDVPNNALRHLRVPNNEGKPVTCSRDTQELPWDIGQEVMAVFDSYSASTSIVHDFEYFEQRAVSLQAS